MSTDYLVQLKKERELIESLLIDEAKSNEEATELLKILEPYFSKIDAMTTYHPIGRLRLERFLLEGKLSRNLKLMNCYGRFANLAEGIFL